MENWRLFFLTALTLFVFHTMCQPEHDYINSAKTLSRRKRYVVYPEGSSFSIAFCVTWKMLIAGDVDVYTHAVNWAVSYDLPNHTFRNPGTNRLVPPFSLRRQRRELYRSLETAMDSGGVNGRSCIKRALCEAAQRLKPKGSLMEEILRVLFTLPQEKVDPYEPIDHHIYDAAYRRGLSARSCFRLYSACPFSMIDVFLGYGA
ncbi:uncharacterized protein [Periplaneta americana]|uniref:uncharacterized protein n=1 Tax=Periplaneta americana TaxID=6978 RepID=UPI0037E82A14